MRSILLLITGLGAACGLPVDDAPTALEVRSDLRPVLTQPATSVPEPDDGSGDGELSLHAVYLFGGDRLTRQVRALEPSAGRDFVTLRDVMDSVVGPLTFDDDGLDTFIPPGTQVRDVSLASGESEIITVNLSTEFFAIEGLQKVRATAQVVFTAIDLREGGADGVRFENEGQPELMPRGDGTFPAQNDSELPPPLTIADFLRFQPRTTDPAEDAQVFSDVDAGTVIGTS